MAIQDDLRSVVFRTDASLQIGIGHVMRCLTLADALKDKGVLCRFICREHKGHLIKLISERGYEVQRLSTNSDESTLELGINKVKDIEPAHASWLGKKWGADAEETLNVLGDERIDWLIVDHYAIDSRWEYALRPACKHLMVIDDLADRLHVCDLLLDQNLGRKPIDYNELVPYGCTLLVGPMFALLRPEFSALRDYSLSRRFEPQLKRLLVTMGGVDQHNATCQVLETLKGCSLPDECEITVCMGPHAPWLSHVLEIADDMRWLIEVKVNVTDMAQLMADSDLAIGAAGGTSWERACLGLPTLLLVLADNQKGVAEALQNKGASIVIGEGTNTANLKFAVDKLQDLKILSSMSEASREITSGQGVDRIIDYLQ